MVGSFAVCCARATTGHDAAAPPKSVMNSRRLMPAPSSGDGILAAQNGTLVGAGPGFAKQHEMQPNIVIASRADMYGAQAAEGQMRTPQQPAYLFDHLVGAGKHCRWNFEVECLLGFKIDDQLVLGRRLYRQVARFRALKDAVDVVSRVSHLVDRIRPVGHQATGDRPEAKGINRR